MGASFGSGASGSLFGATGSANFLSRTTGALAAVFFISTLALGFVGNQRGPAAGGSSVLDRVAPGSPLAPKIDPAKPADAGKSDIPSGVTVPSAPAAGTAAPATSSVPAAVDAIVKPSANSEVPK